MFTRRQQSQQVRDNASGLAANRPLPRQENNGEELEYRRSSGEPSYIANFTKGLPHDDNGLLSKAIDYEDFVRAIDSGDPRDFRGLRLGPVSNATVTPPTYNWRFPSNQMPPARARAWESQGAGLTFDLEGPDAQAVTMPPAPRLHSQELIAEMAEVYWMAALRDIPFANYSPGAMPAPAVQAAQRSLAKLQWFRQGGIDMTPSDMTAAAQSRRRAFVDPSTPSPQAIPLNKLFRGVTKGEDVGPYLSQFLLIGNAGVNRNDMALSLTDGHIAYGAIRVDQRVRVATPNVDYMTDWNEWLDVQNGADARGRETYEQAPGHQYRFITTPRDLATYVHYDALYEAYLNACLIMLGLGVPFDPGIPFQDADFRDKQQGFAQFGGPHILSLVTEVATRALKAVRYQKFNLHRRLRPEAVGGLLYQWDKHQLAEVAVIKPLHDVILSDPDLEPAIRNKANGELLLPMAFPEGSPMHPAYGAGHATVAGACVTILKAFFDHGRPLVDGNGNRIAYEPAADGKSLHAVANLSQPLTVEGELNKLAANISIGRNWAGVHYYSDYIESIRLGERVALGILEEQKLTYGENFSMTVPLFDGGTVRI